MSFVPGDPTFEEHVMMPQYRSIAKVERLPHEGWQAPQSWTIWPHFDYEDLSKTMPTVLHRFEKMSELKKIRISENYTAESEPGYMIQRALDLEEDERERELKIILANRKIERKVVQESERRWRNQRIRESQTEQKRWLKWWGHWRQNEEKEQLRKQQIRYPLSDKEAVGELQYFQLRAIADSGAGDSVSKEKKILDETGLTEEQSEALKRKLELDNLTLEQRKDVKFQEYEDYLEPLTIRQNAGWSIYYICNDEITLWDKPFIYSVPEPVCPTPRKYTKRHWNFIKKKLPPTSPIMNEWGDIAWRFVHGMYFKNKYQREKYRSLFLQWVNSHISLREEPVPRELFVFSQMVYLSKIIRRCDFQKLINLFGSRGYFEKPVYNRRFELLTAEDIKENIYCPINGSPFIELSNYFGGLPNCRRTAWYFNWHFHKLKNVYMWCFENAAYRIYKNILYPGRTDFIIEGEEVVEYLHDDWDGFRRPNYVCRQRVLIHKNRNEDYPLEFYHNILHRLAAEDNWIIGLPHWEAGRYAFDFIHYAYIIRHTLSVIGFLALYLGYFHPEKKILYSGATTVQILGAICYRIYFDGDYLINYDYFAHIFHYHYSPIQNDPEQFYTQFIENRGDSLRKTVERGFYKLMTALTMFYALYRFCWPDAILCSLPCDMVPSHPYPYHPDGTGQGWFASQDSLLQFPPPPYSAEGMALARMPYLNTTQKSIALTGGIITVGLSIGAIVYLLSYAS